MRYVFGNNAQKLKHQTGNLTFNILQPSGHYMYRQFYIQNSAFCPQSVFMCFVWM